MTALAPPISDATIRALEPLVEAQAGIDEQDRYGRQVAHQHELDAALAERGTVLPPLVKAAATTLSAYQAAERTADAARAKADDAAQVLRSATWRLSQREDIARRLVAAEASPVIIEAYHLVTGALVNIPQPVPYTAADSDGKVWPATGSPVLVQLTAPPMAEIEAWRTAHLDARSALDALRDVPLDGDAARVRVAAIVESLPPRPGTLGTRVTMPVPPSFRDRLAAAFGRGDER